MNQISAITVGALNSQDCKQYAFSRQGLDKLRNLPDDIVRLYDIVHRSVGPNLSTMAERVVLTLAVPQNVKHLVVGANSLYRLYASQMFREVRSAVEATGIAWLIRNDEDQYKIFVNDKGQDKASREAAKSAFKKFKIFPAGQPLLVKLSQHYDEASMRAHTTFRGFFNHMSTVPGAITTEFSMTDILPKTAAHVLPNNLVWMCRAHIDIIEAVTKLIFPQEFDVSQTQFVQSLSEVEQQLLANGA